MKFSEAIAMLEKNPSLKFKSQSHIIGVSPNSGFIEIKQADGEPSSGLSHNVRLRDCAGCKANDWQLIREPVPVWEAVKALSEGETIEVVTPNGHEYIIDPQDNECISTHMLLKGKWYIND